MSAEHEAFLTVVQQKAHLSREDAERAAQATLRTLAQRLSKGEALDLAEQLPPEVGGWLHTDSGPVAFRADEFLRRLAEQEGVDVGTATAHARAVFAALGRFVDESEIDDLASELPKDFEPLVAEAQHRFVEVLSLDEFLRRVADRIATDADQARRVIEIVLETLAERIAHGEVEDLEERLPAPLHEALARGDAASGGKATRMSAEAFVRRIAEREGVTPDVARDHARAVFATLREAVGNDEFLDVTAQLSRDYAALEARP